MHKQNVTQQTNQIFALSRTREEKKNSLYIILWISRESHTRNDRVQRIMICVG